MIFVAILSILFPIVATNAEKAFVSPSTEFPKVLLPEAHMKIDSDLYLEFPYKSLKFKSNFGNSTVMNAYYILKSTLDFSGEVRVCWPATIPLVFDFSFISVNDQRLLKLQFTKAGVERENASFNDVEFTIILERLILQAIPISFIRVLLEILLVIASLYLIYPRVISFIESKND